MPFISFNGGKMVKDKSLIEYLDKIKDISTENVLSNPFNPREKFIESEEDELIDSILNKGILNPIIVYKRNKDGKYVILDGERRYRACKKLNIKTIPAHVLVREPTNIENISMMFHIHNVREEWTDFAISFSIKELLLELGKNVHNLKKVDITELKRLTSLSEYKLKKYLNFHDYPEEVIKRFLESEKKEKPDKGVDPDILSEMHRPIKQIKKLMPDFIKKYTIKKIIDACIDKKANNIIVTNKEFRLLSKSLTAAKKGDIRKEVLQDKLTEFVLKREITPMNIYEATSELVYQIKKIIKISDELYYELSNIDLRRLADSEKNDLRGQLEKIVKIINAKLLK